MSPQVETSSLGGLTVLRANSPVGRNRAALVFRVGRFDETLATAGITHMVEHLALAGKDKAPYNFNAEVGGRFTTFFMESADPRDVGDFVSTVCDGLTVGRQADLERETRILRTEAASRGDAGALGMCLANRYGAQGPGLLAYEEFGLYRLGWGEIDAWRRRWFVRGNAVLWVAGTIPGELHAALPPGSQPADAAPQSLPIDLPGYFVSGGGSGRGGIGVSATVPRSEVTAVMVHVLQRRLKKVLRHERGLSYNVQAIWQELYRDQAHIWLAADALPDQISITAHTMLDTIERFASQGCTDEEIQDYARRFRDACQSPDGPAMLLGRHAEDLLEHRPPQDADEKSRLLSVLSPDEVSSACGELLTGAIVVTPGFVPAVDGRMPPLPAWSLDTVTGTSTRSRDSGRVLTIGPDGVMLTVGEGKQVAVKYDALAAWVRWNDNKRALIGEDGFVLQLDPAEWPDGDQLAASVDARIDPQFKIDIDTPGPQRPAPETPSPEQAPPPAAPTTGRKSSSRRSWTAWFFARLRRIHRPGSDVRDPQPARRRRIIQLTAAGVSTAAAVAVIAISLGGASAHKPASVTTGLIARLTGPDGASVHSLAFSPGGRTLATGSSAGDTYLWDVASRQPIATFTSPDSAGVDAVAFSPGGRILATGDANGTSYLWDVATRQPIATLTDPEGFSVTSVAFSPDGRTLATGDANGTAYLWDVATRHLAAELTNPAGSGVVSVAFSPDGHTLATGCYDGSTYLWSMGTRHLSATLTGKIAAGAYSVAFSPDGHTLVAAGFGGRTYLWNVAGASLIATLTDPAGGGAHSVAFSPDGRMLATGDYDGTSYLWDVATRHLITKHTDPRSAGAYSVAFSPDDRMLAVGDNNGSTYVWVAGRHGHDHAR